MKLSECPSSPYDLLVSTGKASLNSSDDSSCSYFGILATVSAADQSPSQRWLNILQHSSGDNKVYFLTHRDSKKIKDVQANSKVSLILSALENCNLVLTMTGKASLLEGDADTQNKLWQKQDKATMIGWLSSGKQGTKCEDDLESYDKEREQIETQYQGVNKEDIKCPEYISTIVIDLEKYNFVIADPAVAFKADVFDYKLSGSSWTIERLSA